MIAAVKDTTQIFVNDTILNLLNQLVTNISVEQKSYYHLSFNEIITLLLAIISVVVAIYQFRKQMYKNREEQRIANKENWFLSVIVLPQIEGVNIFYKELIDDVFEDILELQSVPNDDIVLLSEKQAVRKEQINSFFDHLQSLIRSFDSSLSRKITSEVENLEDEVTIILSDYFFNISSDSNNEIRRRLLLNKKDIIALLYSKTQEDIS